MLRPDAPQRVHDPWEVYNALRWIVRMGAQWRMLPTNVPPWEAVYHQARRWIDAGCFGDMVHELRVLSRWADVLAWFVWRWHHQAIARRCHYKQRGVLRA